MKRMISMSEWVFLLAAGLGLAGCAVPRVNQDIDTILGVYRHEVQKLKDEEQARLDSGRSSVSSTGGESGPTAVPTPWWHANQDGTLIGGESTPATLDDLYVETLMHSSQIRVFTDLPLIRRTGIQEAKGEFDTKLFTEGRYDRANDPVGSTLQTGNATDQRFREKKYSLRSGLRKKIITGGEFEAVQELSRTRSNSTFFVPNPQGNAELKLRYTQPLLQGAGVHYNESTIKIAELDSEVAVQEFLRQTESHLVEVARAYWGLYMARGIYLQKQKLVEETRKVVEELGDRSELDVRSAQQARARAAYANRRADLVRSELAVRNAQDRIKALVNSETLFQTSHLELVPMDQPVIGGPEIGLVASAADALENRPEIQQSFKQLKAAALREDMSRNEVLPVLNVFVEGYIAGLSKEGSYPHAWDNQFSKGAPGYTLGFYAEYPLENQVGRARLERRKLETRQQLNSVKTTIETVLLELKVSVREVNTALRDLRAKAESMSAAREELQQLQDRRGLDVGDEMTASSFLTFLLDSQDRLALAEEEFVRSLVTYNVARVNLERAKGTLLRYEKITYKEEVDSKTDLPEIHLIKEGKPDSRGEVYMDSTVMALGLADPDELAAAAVDPDTSLEFKPEEGEASPVLSIESEPLSETTQLAGSMQAPETNEPVVTPIEEIPFAPAVPEGELPLSEPIEVLTPAEAPESASVESPVLEEADQAGLPVGWIILAGAVLITGAVFGIQRVKS